MTVQLYFQFFFFVVFIILAFICVHTLKVISLNKYSAFFLPSFHLGGHKEFTCCSCTQGMYRPIEMFPPPSGSLASTDAASCYRNRVYVTLRTCGLVQLSFPQIISSLLYSHLYNPFQLLASISPFSIFSFYSHLFFFFFISFYSPSFSTSSTCIILVFSQVLVFLCLFSHIFVQFSVPGSSFPVCLAIQKALEVLLFSLRLT